MVTTTSYKTVSGHRKTFLKTDQNHDLALNQNRILTIGHNAKGLKRQFGDDVYRFLDEKYAPVGGINKGSGFRDVSDMVSSIPIWRIRVAKNSILSAMMFKKNNYGKKMVAYACSDLLDVKKKKSDLEYMLNASYAELSDGLLITIIKLFSKRLHNYVLNADDLLKHKKIFKLTANCSADSIPAASKRLFERLRRQWPELLRFCYIRKIGNENKLKLIMGRPAQNISLMNLTFDTCHGYS